MFIVVTFVTHSYGGGRILENDYDNNNGAPQAGRYLKADESESSIEITLTEPGGASGKDCQCCLHNFIILSLSLLKE